MVYNDTKNANKKSIQPISGCNMISSNRLEWLDFAKGVGILLILYVHFFPVTDPLRIVVISFIVPFFFLLSGYSMPWKENIPFSTRVKKDFRRLLVPYFVYLLLSLPIYLFYQSELPISTVARLIFYLDGYTISFNAPLWFLVALFEVKLLFHLFLYSKPKASYHAVVAILCILISWWIYSSGMSIRCMLGLNKALLMLPFFQLGFWMRRLSYPERITHPIVCGISLFLTGSVLSYLFDLAWLPRRALSVYSWHLNYFWGFILSAVLASVGLLICCYKIPSTRLLDRISRYTVFIMATHYPFSILWKKFAANMTTPMTLISTTLVWISLSILYDFILRLWEKTR